MTNTTASEDKIISAAEDFAQRNECAADSINSLIEVINSLDDKLTEALKDKGDER